MVCRIAAARSAGVEGVGVEVAGDAGGAVVPADAPWAMAARWTSSLMMAPPRPVPRTVVGSTPNSLAKRRAAGENPQPACISRRRRRLRAGCRGCKSLLRRCGSQGRGGGRNLRRSFCQRRAGFSNQGHHSADRHFFAGLRQQFLHRAAGKRLRFDHALGGLHLGQDLAAPHRLARLLAPRDERAEFHVGAELGHHEFSHGD